MTVGPGIAPGLLSRTATGHPALAGWCGQGRKHRRWGLSPRPENVVARRRHVTV